METADAHLAPLISSGSRTDIRFSPCSMQYNEPEIHLGGAIMPHPRYSSAEIRARIGYNAVYAVAGSLVRTER